MFLCCLVFFAEQGRFRHRQSMAAEEEEEERSERGILNELRSAYSCNDPPPSAAESEWIAPL